MAYKLKIEKVLKTEDPREDTANVQYVVYKDETELYREGMIVAAINLPNIVSDINNLVVNRIGRRQVLEAIDVVTIIGEYDVEKQVMVETILTANVIATATIIAVKDTTEIEAQEIEIIGATSEKKIVKNKVDNNIIVDTPLVGDYKIGDKVRQTKTIKL